MNLPPDFQALRTHSEGGRIDSRLVRLRFDDLSPGEVLVRTRYAGVNYKDCLSLHGQAKIITEFPRIAGIELVGEVVQSSDPQFTAGQQVLVHGFQTGIAFDGGFAEYARVPAKHVHPLPEGLTPQEAAILGVPAFTVAMAVERFLELGVTPASGPVALSGATGAVGVMALGILPRAGFTVSAMTRRMEHADALKRTGATEVIDAAVLQQPQRPLEKARFAAAIDNVGGATLSWLLRSLQDGGCLACVGNAAGNTYEGSVLPFIMRRAQMFGVVANAPWPQRKRLWAKLGGEWKPDMEKLAPHVSHIRLGQLMEHAAKQLEGKAAGRVLVEFAQ
ncbi:YhdH/YhfP family quinone oxidoreductase [Ramlibacter albus]|uniref:YhdH/YhfP family quinone oxidoreductase n=1 Tax=Ramlibacter albus TaxID=2079448 RepID=A0A923M4V7_9BURK|nr:YhdH/YhfP family quinone oxidoreductase [Ramlibacter albus]MBC5763995.1 YhdH/YhfP family quinone oxidoreductase [Ramlibacter albus]